MKSPRGQLRADIVDALRGATMAGNEVYAPRDWPTEVDKLETGIIIVMGMQEHKERVRSGQLFYTTTATIDVLARVARGGPETSMRMIDELVEQIASVVITALPPRRYTQFAPNVDIKIGLTSEAQMQVAQALVTFSFEYPERFQLPGVPLKEIQSNPPEGSFGSFDVKLPQ
jgi:hypothetical protein